jgi:hypothetical protein
METNSWKNSQIEFWQYRGCLMRFLDEGMEYLRGEKFSNGYCLPLQDNPLISRLSCLVKLVSGKRVLHIGCCDHIPLIPQKIKNKTWLHGLLVENCSFVAGIDIDDDVVQYVIDYPPHTNPQFKQDKHIYCADITDALL